MGIIYLAALIVGFGTIALQLLMAGSGDGDADGDSGAGAGADAGAADADGADLDGADADGAADAHGGAGDGGGHGHSHAETGFLPIFLSLRFWTFSLLAFGLSGTLMHFIGLASGPVTLGIALGLGFCSGLLAAWTVRALGQAQVNSAGSSRDAIGQVGKVLVPLKRGGRGKVRIELKGQTLDFLVTTDEAALNAGDLVLVEDVSEPGLVLQVGRLPAEFVADSGESPPGSKP